MKNRPMRYKLMNDYSADWPFWGGVEGSGLCRDDDPTLAPDLTEEVRAWAAQFNDSFDWQFGWPDEATATAHRAEGERLFRAVVAALPNDAVTFDYWETGYRAR